VRSIDEFLQSIEMLKVPPLVESLHIYSMEYCLG
jgi:hypothetical protein